MPRLIDHGLRDGKKAGKAKSAKKAKRSKQGDGPARSYLYTKALGDKICHRLSMGESLLSICRTEGFPSDFAVRSWAKDSEHPFASQYAHAREAGYHRIAEETLEIADDGRNDFLQRKKDEGEIVLVDHDHISRSRLRIDVRKWYLSKVLPKIYGEKIQHEGGETPIVHKVGIGWMTKEEAAARGWA